MNVIAIKQLREEIAEAERKISELEAEAMEVGAMEHGWYRFYRSADGSNEYFYMINGSVKRMVSVRPGHVICSLNGAGMLMANVWGWETDDCHQGCFFMNGLNKYKVAADAMNSDSKEISALSDNMKRFRARCYKNETINS